MFSFALNLEIRENLVVSGEKHYQKNVRKKSKSANKEEEEEKEDKKLSKKKQKIQKKSKIIIENIFLKTPKYL